MSEFTLELLESLLSGSQLTVTDLDKMVKSQVREDLHLEYKHGNELQKPGKEPQRTIRQYVSGFANSAGGVLIIGLDEENWQVTGCPAQGSSTLDNWATRCLTPIASQLSPLSRISVVDHPNGKVLVIATQRSLSPVFVIENSKPVYYLRHHDETLLAEEYLVSDLLLGRRNHPALQIVDVGVGGRVTDTDEGKVDFLIRISILVENLGFSKARNIKLGLLHLIEGPSSTVNSTLLSHIQILNLPEDSRFQHFNRLGHLIEPHAPVDGVSLDPFMNRDFSFFDLKTPLRQHNQWFRYPWKAAVYLLPEGSPPTWYQLTLNLDLPDVFQKIQAKNDILFASEFEALTINKLHGEAPVIGWEVKTAS